MSGPRPTVSWNIVGGCNYRCTYCVQKHLPGIGGPTDEQLEAALTTLTALPGSWEFKISGGEPFLLKRLPEVARRLGAVGHKVSLLTNLSAPVRVLATFIEAAGEQLRTFSCSLHREEVEEAEFFEKAQEVKQLLARWPRATFVVNSVMVPGQVSEVAHSRERFEAADIKFYPQLMRVQGKPAEYGWVDRWRLHRAFGDMVSPSQMNRGYQLTGRLCHAGSKYFIIHPKGDAFSCYPGKRFGDGHLGNVFDGTLKLWDAPRPCHYEVCPCTVPQNRGIIEGFGGGAGDERLAF
ncbi:MAG: radical SAM/SPASM domain-containing protein [Cystobacter sp.]